MATVEKFEELRVWQQARELNLMAYKVTTPMKDYPFVDQMRRAALSTMNNTAEGFERKTDADFAHFITISKGSAGEVRSMSYAAEDLNYLEPDSALKLRKLSEELGAGLGSFSNYLRKNTNK